MILRMDEAISRPTGIDSCVLSHSGIGIHGSTNNEASVPGRASEGCIRLRDNDIITLKEKFAFIKMPVHVKGEDDGPWEWEIEAHKKAVPVSDK